ncbi:MAG: hypothetical protein R2684_13510 [Pyrinomonadaceae bacterium]
MSKKSIIYRLILWLALVGLIVPIPIEDIPGKDIEVINKAGKRVPGVLVTQEWYFGSLSPVRSEKVRSNANGISRFDSRRSYYPIALRVASRILDFPAFLILGQRGGPTADFYAQCQFTLLGYNKGRFYKFPKGLSENVLIVDECGIN